MSYGKELILDLYDCNVAKYNQEINAVYQRLEDLMKKKRRRLYRIFEDDKLIKPKKRFKRLRAFRKTGGILLANAASIRHGVDLSNCDTEIYYSTPESREMRNQTEERIESLSKEVILLCIDLVVKDTIDEHVLALVRTKMKEGKKRIGVARMLQKRLTEGKERNDDS